MNLFRKCSVVPLGALVLFCGLSTRCPAQESSAVGAASGPQEPPEIKEFQSIEDKWSEAAVKPDQYEMELLLSPYFVDITSSGEVDTRNQLIAFLFDKTVTHPLSMEQKVASVREFGDTAVVSGTYVVRTHVNGDPREERGIFTHVFEKTRAGWLCVNSQRTAVVEESATKSKKADTKKSDAELPFHIPFLHKGQQPAASQPQQ
jgi:hypothetical protein